MKYYTANMISISLQDAVIHEDASSQCPGVVLVADDLTGALDSAAQFAKLGHGAKVLLRGGVTREPVWAFSTGARHDSAETAGLKVEQNLSVLPTEVLRQTMFLQKIDSAGRGPIGPCILAAAKVIQPEVILCAPAFPALGRSVRQGVLHVRHIAAQDASIQLRSMFPEEVQDRIALIRCGTMASVRAAMVEAQNIGHDIWLCDSDDDSDLRTLVQTALNLGFRILWSGSAGLAVALASEISPPLRPRLTAFSPGGNAWLLICGTAHPVTRLQMERLQARGNAPVLNMQWGTTSVMDIREKFQQSRPDSLIVTGGETAAFVLDALDCDSVHVGGELATGIPWGRIGGGLADGCHIVTKSGGFGDENSLATAADFCIRGCI